MRVSMLQHRQLPLIKQDCPSDGNVRLYCIWSAEAMARNGYLPSDPQALLSYMEDIDSDESDGDFDGYVDSDDEEYVAGREKRSQCMEPADTEIECNADATNENDDTDCAREGNPVSSSFISSSTAPPPSPPPGSIPSFQETVGPIRTQWTSSKLQFTEAVNNSILTESNRYGDKCVENHQQHLQDHPWQESMTLSSVLDKVI